MTRRGFVGLIGAAVAAAKTRPASVWQFRQADGSHTHALDGDGSNHTHRHPWTRGPSAHTHTLRRQHSS